MVDPSDARSNNNSTDEEITSLEPLGIREPLLPAKPLGQTLLQPKFLSPLGARPLAGGDSSASVLQEMPDYSLVDHFPQDNFFLTQSSAFPSEEAIAPRGERGIAVGATAAPVIQPSRENSQSQIQFPLSSRGEPQSILNLKSEIDTSSPDPEAISANTEAVNTVDTTVLSPTAGEMVAQMKESDVEQTSVSQQDTTTPLAGDELPPQNSESDANNTTPLESPSTTPIVQRQPDQLGEATLPKDSHPSETTVQRKPQAEPSATVHEAIAPTFVVEPVSLPESTTPTQAPILQLLSAEPSSQPTFSQTPESANTQTQLSASSVISESAVEETEVSQASVTASVSEPAVVQRMEESSITDQRTEAPPVVTQPAETTVTSQSENLISASSDPTTGQTSSTTSAVPPAREAIYHTATDQTLALSREESSSYNSAAEGLSNEVTETQGSNFLPAEVAPSIGSGNTLSEVAQSAETSVQLKSEVGLPSASSEAVTLDQPATPLGELTQPDPQTAEVLPEATVTSTNPVVQAFSESSSSEATETTSPQLSEPILSQGETSSEARLIQPSLESAPATIAESAAPPNLSAVAVETATPTEAQTAELLPEVTATSTNSVVQAFSEGSSSEAVVQPSLESAPATIAESAAPPNLSAVAVETATPTEAQTAELRPEATATSTPSIVQAFSESSASEATGTGSPQPTEPNFSEAAVTSEPTVTTSELTVAQSFSENPYSESTEADSLKSPALTEHVVTSASEGMISSAPTVVQPQLDSSPTTRNESAATPIPSAVVGETATLMAESSITSEVIVPTPATTQHQELTVVQPRLETALQESTGEASPETTVLSSSPEESTGEMLHLAAEQTTPNPTPLIQAQLEEGGIPELPLADQVAETTIQRQLQQSDQAATASEAPTTTSGVEPVSSLDGTAQTQTDIIQPLSAEESSKPSTESSPEVGESLAFPTLESEAIVQRQPSEETANAFDTAEAPSEVQEQSLVQRKQEFPESITLTESDSASQVQLMPRSEEALPEIAAPQVSDRTEQPSSTSTLESSSEASSPSEPEITTASASEVQLMPQGEETLPEIATPQVSDRTEEPSSTPIPESSSEVSSPSESDITTASVSQIQLMPQSEETLREIAAPQQSDRTAQLSSTSTPEPLSEVSSASESDITAASVSQVQLMPQSEETLPEIAAPQQSDRTEQPSSTPTPEFLSQDTSPLEPEITTLASQVQLMPQSEATLPEIAAPAASDRTAQLSSTPTAEPLSEPSSPSEPEITTSASEVQLMPQSEATLPEIAAPAASDRTEQPSSTPIPESASEVSSPSEPEITASASQVQLMPQSEETLPQIATPQVSDRTEQPSSTPIPESASEVSSASAPEITTASVSQVQLMPQSEETLPEVATPQQSDRTEQPAATPTPESSSQVSSPSEPDITTSASEVQLMPQSEETLPQIAAPAASDRTEQPSSTPIPESLSQGSSPSEPDIITDSVSQVQLMPQSEEALPEIAAPAASDRIEQPSSTPTAESSSEVSSASAPEITTASVSQVQLMPQSEETLPQIATPQVSDRTEQPSSTPTIESASEVSSASAPEITTASVSQVQLMPQSGDTLPEAEVDSSSQSGGLIVEPSSSVQDIVQTKLEGQQVAAPTDVAASTGDTSLTSTVETLPIEATTTLSPPQDNNLDTQIGTGSDVTVAQLFSEAKETPVLPTVLENLGQINPLGQSSSLGQPSVEATSTSPLLSRQSSSSLSGQISPMIQRMPDSSVGDSSEITLNQPGMSDRVSRQAELTPMNLSSLSSTATDSNVDIQQVAPISHIISRQESQDAMTQVAPSTDIPTSWSSIADLLGGSNTVDSEPPVIQRHPEHQQSIDSQSPVIQRHQDNGRSDSKAEDLVFTPEGFRRGDSPVASSTSKVRRSLIQTKKRQRSSAYPILEKELPSGADSTESSSNEVTISRQTPQEDDSYNLEILAQEIYSLVQQRLQIEQERHGRHYSGRLPW
jgi:hypothetical protein